MPDDELRDYPGDDYDATIRLGDETIAVHPDFAERVEGETAEWVNKPDDDQDDGQDGPLDLT